jgi:peptide deformylase
VAKDVDVAQKEELQSLVTEMFETLTASNGVGLAAPQIGRSIRVVVIDLTVLSDEYPEYKDFRHVFYNAHVLEGSEETDTMEEGCLSLPGISEKVERPAKVHVKYLDENFQPHDEWVSGYLARVMQHEFDHLEGQMFVDKISSFRRQMIKSKLSNFLKGKTRCSYKVKTLK